MNRKVAGSIPAGVSGFFFDIKSFRSHYGPEVDSASNTNEYQEYFLRGKVGRCVRLTTLPASCAVVTKFGNLKFLEPPGPVHACNGTALPLIYLSFQWCNEAFQAEVLSQSRGMDQLCDVYGLVSLAKLSYSVTKTSLI